MQVRLIRLSGRGSNVYFYFSLVYGAQMQKHICSVHRERENQHKIKVPCSCFNMNRASFKAVIGYNDDPTENQHPESASFWCRYYKVFHFSYMT